MLSIINALLLAFATLAVILPGVALTVASAVQWVPGDCPAAYRAAMAEGAQWGAEGAQWGAMVAEAVCEARTSESEYLTGAIVDAADVPPVSSSAFAWAVPPEGVCWLEVCPDVAPVLTVIRGGRSLPRAPMVRQCLPPSVKRGRQRDKRGRFVRAA